MMTKYESKHQFKLDCLMNNCIVLFDNEQGILVSTPKGELLEYQEEFDFAYNDIGIIFKGKVG